MVTQTPGYKKLEEKAKGLKQEVKQKEEVKEQAMASVKNELEEIRKNNPELLKMYQESATIGAANLSGSLPLLKVQITGKSSTNYMPDGSEPENGWFFYKPTQEQFKEVICHILTISRGYRSEGLQGRGNVFNQILSGVMIEEGKLKPFLMYFTGKKLKNMWEFGKEASKYTRAKPVPIPMFALTVKLTTAKEKNDYGYSWIVNFQIQEAAPGMPVIITDPKLFQALKDSVANIEDTVASLIESKSTGGDDEEVPPQTVKPLGEDQKPVVKPKDDIPF